MNVLRFALLALIVLVTAACERVQFRQDDTYSYLTITLTEQETTDLIEGLLTGGTPPLLRTASADLQGGEIYVTGTAADQSGATYDGSLTVRMTADDNGLSIVVTSFNFAGFTADQSALDGFNRSLAEGLSRRNENRTNDSEITEVQITDTALMFTIRTPRTDR